MNQFANIQALENWLNQHKVKHSLWDQKNSKSLQNLWQELEAGEVYLKNNPPLRVVDVVQIIIQRDEQILVEAEQEFFNGQRRFRNQPPSEKIKPNETVKEAAIRCLREELGVKSEQITLHLPSLQKHQTNTNSISYPGLQSQYNFHLIEASVAGLPDKDFWRENQTGEYVDPVKRHLWAWRPKESIAFITDQ